MDAGTTTLNRPTSISDTAHSGAEGMGQQRFDQRQQQELSLAHQIILGLRDNSNFRGTALLSLLKEQFSDHISALGSDVTPTSLIRELESKFLIECRSWDARKAREDSVWNLTPMGAIWALIYETTFEVKEGAGFMLTRDYIKEHESLINFSATDIGVALINLDNTKLVSDAPAEGFFLTNSPFYDLI